MDRMVKASELLYTRRHCTNSASGCHAVTNRYVAGRQATSSCLVDKRPPASRQNLTDPLINAERGKPDLFRRFLRRAGRKADRKEGRREAG